MTMSFLLLLFVCLFCVLLCFIYFSWLCCTGVCVCVLWGRVFLSSWVGTCSARVLRSQGWSTTPEETSLLKVAYISRKRKTWEHLWLANRLTRRSEERSKKYFVSFPNREKWTSSYGKRLIYFRPKIMKQGVWIRQTDKQTTFSYFKSTK